MVDRWDDRVVGKIASGIKFGCTMGDERVRNTLSRFAQRLRLGEILVYNTCDIKSAPLSFRLIHDWPEI